VPGQAALRNVVNALHVVALLFVLAGIAALWDDLSWTWRIVMVAVVVPVAGLRLAPLTRWLGNTGSAIVWVGSMLGLIVIPVVALLGIDAALALLHFDPVSPWRRLAVGAVIVVLVGRISLEPLWSGEERLPCPWLFAADPFLLLIVIPSVVIAVIGQINGDGRTLDQRRVVADLDVIVLRTGAPPAPPATIPHDQWRVHTWSGEVKGTRVIWGGGRQPQLAASPDADRVLLLIPPRADNDAVARWMALADQVEPRATPTYALLHEPDDAQLQAWRVPLAGVVGRSGDALAIAQLGGDSTPDADLGLRAATESPVAGADLGLAVAHRPVLRFDRREPTPRPLDVDKLFAMGLFAMCEGGQKVRSRCVQIDEGADLQTGFNHLAFDTRKVVAAADDVPSLIYVHVTHVPAGFPRVGSPPRIYLDYWWYLPDNPAHAGSGAFCGPGFTIAGATCFDHQSDWEGVTVILNPADAAGRPIAVNYAEHDGSVRYSWRALQRLWQLTHVTDLAPHGELATRPLVFSARGTHASYPVACSAHSCPRNAVPGIRDTAALRDKPHDGWIPWRGVTDSGCASACVALLPTRRGGTEPEGWNAWGGEWGTANCIMGVVCASADPPQSPGQQARYEHPWCRGGAFDLAGTRFSGPGDVPACVSQTVALSDLTLATRLLALGDSYSSGEGAGHYEPGTDTSSNTCHRSRSAWPTLVADQRRLKEIRPSLACSGATVTDVLSGRAGGQPERTHSQIGRITGEPDLITITIGGNDLGFRKILENCIKVNCVKTYHRESGDILDHMIDDLALRLPAVYRAIQAAALHARIVVVDYPRLFPPSNPNNPTPNCAARDRISPTEANYLNDKIKRADIAILDVAKQVGVDAVDVSDAFAGGELSCHGPQYVNHVNPQLKVLSGSFHPNADGQERLARVVIDQLASMNQ
jgi:lysophospholipase L1-like esterase